MRKLFHDALCVILTIALVLMTTGCANRGDTSDSAAGKLENEPVLSESGNEIPYVTEDEIEALGFKQMGDAALLRHIEDYTYNTLVSDLNSDEYLVESVQAVYVSQEYLDELAYNTQANIYFGYTLADIEESFEGEKYVFTVDDNGKTVVKAFEDYDDTYDQIIRNVAIGGGVILVCVTISVVTAGAGMPAASWIFAVGAKEAGKAALSGALIGGAIDAAVTGLQGGNVEETLKSAALGASQGFKWGAIGGALKGTVGSAKEYGKAVELFKGIKLNGLTPQQAALIQCESKIPIDVIKELTSMEQYEILKKAGVFAKSVGGKTALIRKIDLKFKDELGRTNLERMKQGLAALDPATGKPLELHHIGQKIESTLAILTQEEHRLGDSYKIWHLVEESLVHADEAAWAAQRKAFWQSLASILAK